MSGLWLVSYVVLWLLFLAVAFALLSVLRNTGELAEAVKRLHAPRDTVTLITHTVAPPLALHAANGTPVATTDFRGQPTTYAVISPGCGPCRSFVETLADGVPLDAFPTTTQRVIVTVTADDDQRAELRLPPDVTLLFDTSNSAAEQWGARSTPTFITLDAEGRYITHTIGFTPPAVPAGAPTTGQS